MICKLELFTNFIYLTAPQYVLDFISTKFTYRDVSEAFVWGRFVKENVKIVKLLKMRENQHAALPIGLLDELIDIFNNTDIEYKTFDKRKKVDLSFTDDEIKNCTSTPLWPHQIEAIKVFLQEQNMIIKAATGSGKTKVMAALTKLLDLPTLVLMHKVDLVRQTAKRFAEDGISNVGIVQGTKVKPDRITLATIQSAHKIEDLEQFEFVMVDEVHRANAPTYQTVLMHMSNAHFKLGLSATPFNKDKLHNARVKSWIGDVKFDLNAKQLIDKGYLAEPTIKIIPIKKATQKRQLKKGPKIYNRNIEDYSWPGAERNGIIHNYHRNEKIAELAVNAPAPVLVLVKNIDHGKTLNKIIPNSVFIYGETDTEERESAIKQFEEQKNIILIGSTILDEGIDIVSLKTLIVCAGGKSFIRALQRVGRALRKTKTKHEVLIYDFYDSANRYLERHSNERIKAYRKEGFHKISIVGKDNK